MQHWINDRKRVEQWIDDIKRFLPNCVEPLMDYLDCAMSGLCNIYISVMDYLVRDMSDVCNNG